MATELLLYGEIRDVDGQLDASTNATTLAEMIGWYKYHGIDFADVKSQDTDSGYTRYTYRKAEGTNGI